MSTVMADQTTVYGSKDRSDAIGSLPKGSHVAVIAQDSDMTQTPDGWIPSADVDEDTMPWTAEVTADSAVLYAKPDAAGDILRTAGKGDLVRVTGVAPGIEGDTSTWWATTDGYADLHSLNITTNPYADQWTLPTADDAPHGWWGQVEAANVRAAPSTDAPVVGEFAGGEHVKVLSEEHGDAVKGNDTWYRIDGGRFAGGHVHSSLIQHLPDPQPTLAPSSRDLGQDPWIVVDRAASTLTVLRAGQPEFTTYVSLGKAGVDTPDGEYSTFIKYRADRMTSTTVPEAEHDYELPNVPFTQYFRGDGSAIHGTYWHDAFGTRQSQGCINLTWSDSQLLFQETSPHIPNDQIGFSVAPDQATPVVIVN